jgi:hypothetical protein
MELEKRRAEKRSEVRFSLGLTRVWIEVIKRDYLGLCWNFRILTRTKVRKDTLTQHVTCSMFHLV